MRTTATASKGERGGATRTSATAAASGRSPSGRQTEGGTHLAQGLGPLGCGQLRLREASLRAGSSPAALQLRLVTCWHQRVARW